MIFSEMQIKQEIARLYNRLKNVGWTLDDCHIYAPLTLEINTLKKTQSAIILAHSYQTPDIMYGVADFIGDSYGLSKIATEHPAQKIIFCSVHFMGETAKILNPKKEVLVPSLAGCSLAESITADDVKNLRKKYPQAGIVCYVNTSAAVKAESDVCCTSANAVRIVDAMPQAEIIFIPDQLMGENLKKLTRKKIITWPGTCIVHETFTADSVRAIREQYPNVKILAHIECSPSVIAEVDHAGSTSSMLEYIKKSPATTFMMVTECGLTDRVKTEHPNKQIVGTCALCPYMKKIELRDILKALKNPSKDQIIEIPTEILTKAKRSLDKMWELEKYPS